jgi:hypothetical protein
LRDRVLAVLPAEGMFKIYRSDAKVNAILVDNKIRVVIMVISADPTEERQ